MMLRYNSNDDEFICLLSRWEHGFVAKLLLVGLVNLHICVKVGKFVQNLVATWLAHSFKHPTPIPLTKINAQPTQLPMHKSLESLSTSQGSLLRTLPNALILNHIFTCFPMRPSMLWRLYQVNKGWFKVVGKSVAWNEL